jgi:hypothetical protein
MLLEGAIEVDTPIRRSADERDAPARAVHFGVKDIIGWTGLETETTVDTLAH